MDKLSVLVLGDGILGKEITNQTAWDFLSRKKDGINALYFGEWSSKLDKYEIIVNCIANTNTYSQEKEVHWNLNYKFVYELINYCNKNNKKLIHISTDYIYSGSIAMASENDVPVHCNNWYGYTKLLGDSLVQLMSNNFLICRLSHKQNPFPYEKAWVDIKTNCDYVDIIAKYVITLIQMSASGVFNVGTEIKSIYDLSIKTRNTEPIYKPYYVPSDTSMSINKLLDSLK